MQIPKITRPMVKDAVNATINGINSVGRDAREIVARHTGELKDRFIKSDIKNNLNKDTAIGAALIISALVLAGKCIKGMVNKLSEIRKEK